MLVVVWFGLIALVLLLVNCVTNGVIGVAGLDPFGFCLVAVN